MKMNRLGILLLTFITLSGCVSTSYHPEDSAFLGIRWQALDSLNAQLPADVRAFRAENTQLPLRAWMVWVKSGSDRAALQVLEADDPEDRRETTSALAAQTQDCVMLNAGYFTMNKKPADHVGLLMENGVLKWNSERNLKRDTLYYTPSRAAFGIDPRGKAEITWAFAENGRVFRLPRPIPIQKGRPAAVSFDAEALWQVRDAVGAGPMLMQDGQPMITVEEEVFFGTSIPNVHPRSAVGTTRKGDVILMVVDGRQPTSRGVSLEELAELMRSAKAFNAMNLDGGGSSTLVVQQRRLNRPVGGSVEREVVSALGVRCMPTQK